MTYRQQVYDLAEKLGATIEQDNSSRSFVVDAIAPAGHHWKCGAFCELHDLVSSVYRGPWSKDELWKDLLERMNYGVERCNSDCEYWCDETEAKGESQ